MQQYCMQPPFGLKGDVDVEIGMETEDVHHEMKQMEMLHRHFKPDAKYLKVVTCSVLSRRPRRIGSHRFLLPYRPNSIGGYL